MRRFLLLVTTALAAVVVVAGPAAPASAHPLGNFTVNTYSGLRVGPTEVSVDFLVDMAEIPTLQSRDDVEAAGVTAYARRTCASIAGASTCRSTAATWPWPSSRAISSSSPGRPA